MIPIPSGAGMGHTGEEASYLALHRHRSGSTTMRRGGILELLLNIHLWRRNADLYITCTGASRARIQSVIRLRRKLGAAPVLPVAKAGSRQHSQTWLGTGLAPCARCSPSARKMKCEDLLLYFYNRWSTQSTQLVKHLVVKPPPPKAWSAPLLSLIHI